MGVLTPAIKPGVCSTTFVFLLSDRQLADPCDLSPEAIKYIQSWSMPSRDYCSLVRRCEQCYLSQRQQIQDAFSAQCCPKPDGGRDQKSEAQWSAGYETPKGTCHTNGMHSCLHPPRLLGFLQRNSAEIHIYIYAAKSKDPVPNIAESCWTTKHWMKTKTEG